MPKTEEKDIFPSLNLSDINFDLSKLITEKEPEKEPEKEEVSVVGTIAGGIATELAKEAVTNILGLRVSELPDQIDDFAKIWYHSLADAGSKYRINRFNAAIQTLQELDNGSLELEPVNGMIISGKQLAQDIKQKIITLFAQRCVDINIADNLYHKAFFGHCAERVLENLKYGIFKGENGFEGKMPEVADIITNRMNEIFTSLTLEA